MNDTKKARLTNAIDLFGKSYELVQRNFKLFAILYFIPFLTVLIDIAFILNDEKDDSRGWGGLLSYSLLGPELSLGAGTGVLLFVFSILSILATLMLTIAYLRAAQGKQPSFDDIWAEFKQKGLRLLILTILLAVALVIGFILLVIPGVIFLWRFFMAPYVLIDKNTGIKDAINTSWEMTSGYAWPIYSIILVTILLSVPSIVPVLGGLLTFLLSVAYSVAPALRYEEIKNQPKPPVKEA